MGAQVNAKATPREAALAQLHEALARLEDDLAVVWVQCRSGFSQLFAVPPAPQSRAAPEGGCSGDVIRALREAGRRLTFTEIQRRFDESSPRVEWGERTLRRHLAALMADSIIDNDQDASPPGYGLKD